MNRVTILFLTLIVFAALACKNQNTIEEEDEYEGPIGESYDVETKISDSAMVKLAIRGPKQVNFQNGDFQYPEGVNIEFYDSLGNVTSTIKANRGYYIKAENVYKVEEDVEVINYTSGEKLNSEELFWNPKEETVYTDKFVNITTETEIIKGVGLTADQDFSNYQMGKITGIISIEEEF